MAGTLKTEFSLSNGFTGEHVLQRPWDIQSSSGDQCPNIVTNCPTRGQMAGGGKISKKVFPQNSVVKTVVWHHWPLICLMFFSIGRLFRIRGFLTL
jgi:hypothetical protein